MACHCCGENGHTVRTCRSEKLPKYKQQRIEQKKSKEIRRKKVLQSEGIAPKQVEKKVRKPAACGICNEEGHTRQTCKDPSAAEENIRRKGLSKDEKEKEDQEKRKQEKKKKEEEQKKKLGIGKEKKDLHQPTLEPGKVKEDYANRCLTVEDVVETVFPRPVMEQLLKIVNENRERDWRRKKEKWVERQENPFKYQKEMAEIEQFKKGRPGFASTAKPIWLRSVKVPIVVAAEKKKKTKWWMDRKVYTQEITVSDFRKFLSILFYSSSTQELNIRHYWRHKTTKAKHPFVRTLLARDRFLMIYHCFRFTDAQLLEMEPDVQALMENLWDPATAVDETMIKTKSRKNPHHVFIMRKPHPHGIKVWSLVDASGYMIAFSVFRREQEKESPSDTINRMTQTLKAKTLVTGDSLFGTIESLEKLSSRGMYCLFSCNQSRPAVLFKDYLWKQVSVDGENESCYGEVPGQEEEKIPFVANALRSKGRNLCTISTVFSDTKMASEVTTLVDDASSDTQQQELVVDNEERPEVRVKYAELMSFVDTCDQIVNAGLCPNKKFHWSQTLKVWELTMLLLNNGRKLFVSATGQLNVTIATQASGKI